MVRPAVSVQHLVKRYGRFTAVQDVSFDVPPGQVTALLGPNGAGKTTIIEVLAGLLAPSSGRVRVLGADPRPAARPGRAWRARIGLVLQSASLDAQLTVAEALRLFAQLYPWPLPVPDVLAAIGLAATRPPGSACCPAASAAGWTWASASSACRPAVPRRADHRPGPGGPAAAVGGDREADRGRHHRAAHHALPGRGRAAGEPPGRLAGGRVVADATPAQLRGSGALPSIRLPLAGEPLGDLPGRLARHADPGRGELLVRTAASLPISTCSSAGRAVTGSISLAWRSGRPAWKRPTWR